MLSLCLGACSSKKITEGESISFLKRVFDKNTYNIYQIDIQQGNHLPEEKLARLKPGLTKKQIIYLLGNPVTATLFHRNRWDYTYYMQNGKTRQREIYKVVLFFEEDTLFRIKKTKLRSKDS